MLTKGMPDLDKVLITCRVGSPQDVHSPRRTTIKVSSDDKHNQKRFIHSVAFVSGLWSGTWRTIYSSVMS